MLDRMSHLLFTALSATPSTRPSSEASRKAQEFELAARKMASVHPALVLRHLPMVASSLRGRSHYDYSVFRNRHLAYFQQILGILELCQPHLFHRQHADALLATLDCYMSIFKVGKQCRYLMSSELCYKLDVQVLKQTFFVISYLLPFL